MILQYQPTGAIRELHKHLELTFKKEDAVAVYDTNGIYEYLATFVAAGT